tara:strand:- start:187 stop:594 length:408 start_codon:yes stop_codon:yes gene_type:complete
MNHNAISLLASLGVFASVLVGPAHTNPYPAGDAAKGAKVFKKCVSCHMIGAKAKNRVGPQLNNIIGREIAVLEDYKYSKAMKAYAEQEPVWSEAVLDAYLTNPRKAVKGTRMSFAGLRKEKDRHNVIEYMKQASQ